MPRLVAMVSLALFVVACGSDNNKKREFLSNEDIRVDGTEEKIRSIHESGPTPYFPFQELLANTYDIEAVSSSALTHYAKHVAANIDVLHAAWLNTSSIDVAKRQRIAHLFFRLLKNTDEEPFAWNSNGSGEGLVSETRLAELFQCLLAFNDKTRNFALFAYQQNDFMDESNECVRVLADQLESAPVEVLYVYGEAILETQFPPQTLPRAWEAVRAAYDVALKRDQQGLEAKRPYDWSLPCVYIGGRRFRESVIAALDDLPDQYTVSMLLHVMQNETVPELLDAAASALKAQNQPR